jgi:EpsI family protein
MPENSSLAVQQPWRSTPIAVVSLILFVQIISFYSTSTAEYIPSPPPLKQFATTVGPWQSVREFPIESEVQAFLKADDTLNREYVGAQGGVNLFVAFFKTQRAGVTPHSPKVCLPGAGWTPESSQFISVKVQGESDPIPVNRYIVRHGDQQSLVMYWYQGAHRVVASEYMSKLYLMVDSLRYNRSDAALVRVIAPVVSGDVEKSEIVATQFIQQIYAPLKQQMWR